MITPLYKKDEKCLASNYRPISLTSVICKIMKSIIKDDSVSYICNNNISTILQHGFLPGRSCQSNLLIMLNCLTGAIDRGIITDVIYLDFARAFDSTPHNRLKPFNIKVRKMTVKIQHVKMQGASFWTVRYQTLYDDKY